MLANYGYQDGSGAYYIRIDTAACVDCAGRGCLTACPEQLFAPIIDDYDDEVVEVREACRQRLASHCAACKPVSGSGYGRLPCAAACPAGAIVHSW